MEKISLSVAAVILTGNFILAGTLTVNKTVMNHSFPESNISKEMIKSVLAPFGAVNLSDFNYTPDGITYNSLANPVLNITFNNAVAIKEKSSSVYVCAINSDGYPKAEPPVLKFDSMYKNTLIFKALNKDSYMTNGMNYGFFTDVNESNCANTFYTDKNNFYVGFNIENAKPIYIEISLAAADSQQKQDSAFSAKPVLGVVQQFCAGVSSKFGKSIDPSSGFIAFKQSNAGCLSGNCTDTLDTSDSVTVNILSDACNNIFCLSLITSAKGNIIIHSSKFLPLRLNENNETSYGTSYNVTAAVETATNHVASISIDTGNIINTENKTFIIPFYLYNINTYNKTDSYTSYLLRPYDKNFSVTFKVNLDGKNQIPLNRFTADVNLTTLGHTLSYTETLLKDADAGEWEYNASVATIPYMAADNNTQTAIRVVNPSGIEAEVYWTCRDDEGKEVENMRVKSTEGTDSIKAGGAEAWLASDILKAAQGEDPEFALDGKMSCEVILINGDGGIKVVPVMSIDGKRDRVIPVVKSE